MATSSFPSFPLSRRVLCATAAAALLLCHGPAALAATPKDTLVVAFAFDDIITMDPAEAFELSAGEVMGNTYDRLVRLDVNDPSKLIGDVAKSWTVSPDGKTYTFEIGRHGPRLRHVADQLGRVIDVQPHQPVVGVAHDFAG